MFLLGYDVYAHIYFILLRLEKKNGNLFFYARSANR